MSEHQEGNQPEELTNDSAGENVQAGFQTRIFGTPEFFRLWLAQVVSATGDWLGLLAISILAIRVGSGSEGAALSLVLVARIAPGFFFGPIAGAGGSIWGISVVRVPQCYFGPVLWHPYS